MKCLACTQVCPAGAIEIAEQETCTRLLETDPPLHVNDAACTSCGECEKVCPIGGPAASARSCSFCLVCSGRSRCILPAGGRGTMGDALASFLRLVTLFPTFFSS